MQQMARPQTLRISRELNTAISAPVPIVARQIRKIALRTKLEAGNAIIWPPRIMLEPAALRAWAVRLEWARAWKVQRWLERLVRGPPGRWRSRWSRLPTPQFTTPPPPGASTTP